MTEELLPCPFCGADVENFDSNIYDKSMLGVFCIECFSCGVEGPHGVNIETATKAWNTREEPQERTIKDAPCEGNIPTDVIVDAVSKVKEAREAFNNPQAFPTIVYDVHDAKWMGEKIKARYTESMKGYHECSHECELLVGFYEMIKIIDDEIEKVEQGENKNG